MSPGVDSTAARGRAGWISVDPRWLGELAGRELGPLIAGWVLPFVLIVYLALKGGGYSSVVHGQVGVAAWWFVLLGALIGVLPAARVRPVAWLALGLASAFAVWTALGIGWSESAGRSVAELGRVAAYFGVFALALAVQGRDGLRRMVGAVAAAIAVVGLVALLSRLHPEWFPPDDTVRVLRLKDRLSYPLNYWNGLAALMAIGLPLALALAAGARTLITRALAGAAVPLLALTTLYTLSRGGIAAAAIGVVAVIALSPRRLAMMPTLLAVGGGTAILLAGALQRGELSDGARTAIAHAQGDEMLAMTLVVCAGVALIQVAIALADRHGLGPRPSVSRPATAAMLAGAAVVALAVGLAAGVPGEISDRWEVFKQPGTPGGGIERLESAQGSFRYQAWGSALDANATDPLTGIGPGTFEFWWAQEREVDTFIRDAHSLYLEMLGELGIVGLVLIVGMIGTVLIAGSRGAFSGDHDARAMCAAATAGCISFAVAAAVDWAWELAVLPIVFFLLSGAILGPVRAASGTAPSAVEGGRRPAALPLPLRATVIAVAAAALVAIAIPLAGTGLVQDSQADAKAGALGPAFENATDAARVEPFAGGPRLQQALVLELAGNFNRAADLAREATGKERTNWRNWLVLSRLDAARGRPVKAEKAYGKARSLNPRSPVFDHGAIE